MDDLRALHRKLLSAAEAEHSRVLAQTTHMHEQELASAQRVKGNAQSIKDLIKSVKTSTQEVESLQQRVGTMQAHTTQERELAVQGIIT